MTTQPNSGPHANEHRPTADRPSVEDLGAALRIYRRCLPVLLVILIGGFAAVIGFSHLGTWLAPPYGLRIMGWTLTEWGLVLLVVGLLAYLWVTGRKLGDLLNDHTLRSMTIVGILTVLHVIAQHAHARGLEWSGFLGPLRPVRR